MRHIGREFSSHLFHLFLFPVLPVDSLQKRRKFFIYIIFQRFFQIQRIDRPDQTSDLYVRHKPGNQSHCDPDQDHIRKNFKSRPPYCVHILRHTQNRSVFQSHCIIQHFLSDCIRQADVLPGSALFCLFNFFSAAVILQCVLFSCRIVKDLAFCTDPGHAGLLARLIHILHILFARNTDSCPDIICLLRQFRFHDAKCLPIDNNRHQTIRTEQCQRHDQDHTSLNFIFHLSLPVSYIRLRVPSQSVRLLLQASGAEFLHGHPRSGSHRQIHIPRSPPEGDPL